MTILVKHKGHDSFVVGFGITPNELGALSGIIDSNELEVHGSYSTPMSYDSRFPSGADVRSALSATEVAMGIPRVTIRGRTDDTAIVALFEQIRAIRAVTSLVQDRRNASIKAITVQDLIYHNKAAEARAFLNDPEADVSLYPYVAMHAELSGVPAIEAAAAIIEANKRDYTFALNTERIRCSQLALVPGIRNSTDSQAIIDTTRRQLAELV